jgi:hypothetical protein
MNLLLFQPLWSSVAITLVLATAMSALLYCAIHPFWARHADEDTRKLAEMVSTRTGVVYGVVVGMMFTYVRVEHTQMMLAVESEASAVVRLHNILERSSDPRWDEAKEDLVDYVHFVVDTQWPALRSLRALPATGSRDLVGTDALSNFWRQLAEIGGESPSPDHIRIRELLEEIEVFRLERLFDLNGALLPLFWVIAFAGYFLTVVTFFFPPPTMRRVLLVSLFSCTVGLVLLGVYVLTHPYSVAAGMEPTPFRALIDAAQPRP